MVITTDPGSIYNRLQYSLPPGFLKNIFILKILAAFLYGGRQGQHKYLDVTQEYRIEHIY